MVQGGKLVCVRGTAIDRRGPMTWCNESADPREGKVTFTLAKACRSLPFCRVDFLPKLPEKPPDIRRPETALLERNMPSSMAMNSRI